MMSRFVCLTLCLCLLLGTLGTPVSAQQPVAATAPASPAPTSPASSSGTPAPATASPVVEAPTAPLSERTDKSLKDWTKSLGKIETTLEKGGLPDDALDTLTAQLRQIREDARRLLPEITPRVSEAERLLSTLTAPDASKDGAAAEPVGPDDPQRIAYTKDLSTWKTRLASVELVATRSDALLSRISNIRRSALVTNLFERTPYPWHPGSLGIAYDEILRTGAEVLQAPADWIASLSQDGTLGTQSRGLIVALWIVVGLALGLALRWWILKKVGRNKAIRHPTYTQRTLAALGEGVANGVLPALIMGSLVFWSQITFGDYVLLRNLADAVFISVLLLLLARAFTRALLAPDMPQWRVGPHSNDQAGDLSFLIQALVAVVCLEFLFIKADASLQFAPEAKWIALSIFKFLEGGLLIRMSRPDLWTYEKEPKDTEGTPPPPTGLVGPGPSALEDAGSKSGQLLGLLARSLVLLAAIVGSLAALFGYGHLGSFLINGLLATCVFAGAGLMLRTLLNELLELATNSSWVRSRVNWGDKAWEQARFWLRGVIFLVLLGIVVFLVAPVWGVPSQDVADTFVSLVTGFKIGNVTISLVSIAIGAAVFVVLTAVSRSVQSTLAQKVLVQTNMDSGARNSLITAIGYLGFIVSAAVGIAAMGFDLSNIALIAGALSVGIGFGLQAIVSNFVSGLILLVERPIKVGDWVNISGNEGIVKRISFRATELETFAKAAIIIPNSTLIQSPFTNLTHRNRLGRVQVDIVVDNHSDVDQVRDILMNAARDNDLVLTMPAPSVSLTNLITGSSLQPGSLAFSLYVHTANISNGGNIRSDLRAEIYKRFQQAGIAFA